MKWWTIGAPMRLCLGAGPVIVSWCGIFMFSRCRCCRDTSSIVISRALSGSSTHILLSGGGSGIRCLTEYFIGWGFKKVDPDRWEFANEGFLRGHKHLLKTIRRRRPPPNPPLQLQSLSPSLEIGRYALDGEIERLKRDKNLLMAEVIKLRQEQQSTRAHIQTMEERMQGNNQKQQQFMAFLARAMQNPDFLQQLQRNDLAEAFTKKRRRPIDFSPSAVEEPFGFEGDKVQDSYQFDGTVMESLETELRELENNVEEGDDAEERRGGDLELNEEFWEELLSDAIGDEGGDDNVKGLG